TQMRTRRLRWPVLLALLVVGGCAKPEFKEYQWAEAKCKFAMPGTIKDYNQDQPTLNIKMKGAEQKEGAYLVAYADLPEAPKDEATADAALEGGLKSALGSYKDSKKVSEKPLDKLDGKYPGKEMVMDFKTNDGKAYRARIRLYLVDRRLYQLWSIGSASWV